MRRVGVLALVAVLLLAPGQALAQAKASVWGDVDDQSLSVMKTAHGIAATEKAILQMKLDALSGIKADINDRLLLLKAGNTTLTQEENAALTTALADLDEATGKLAAQTDTLNAARKTYADALAKRDVKATTTALSTLAGCYDDASSQANLTGAQLRVVLKVLKSVPVTVATPVPTAEETAAAEGAAQATAAAETEASGGH